MRAVLCLLLFAVLTVEDSAFGGGTWHTVMFRAEPFFHGNPVNAWDVSVALVGVLAALNSRRLRQQVWPLNRALVASGAALVVLVAWGIVRGGDFRMSYFQLKALLRLFLLFPVVLAVFRTRRDLQLLAATVMAAALYRAAACMLAHRYFLENVGVIRWPESMTDHHDSVLWALALVGLTSWVLFRFRLWRLLVGSALALPLLLAIHYNDRRLAWIQVAGALVLMAVAVPRGRLRRQLLGWTFALTPVLALYLAVGWERSGALFAPVRQIRSAVTATGARGESNTYRDLENIGLVVTLQRTRFLGTGFGHPFEEITGRYSAGMAQIWSEYAYMPHNSVLGLAAFAGALGFPVVWCFLPVGAFLAARALAFAQRPVEQVLASVGFVYPFVYGVQAFGDVGLQSVKANVLLACTLAIGARLAVLTGAWPVRRASHHPGAAADAEPQADGELDEAPPDSGEA